jgi:outer membrane lipoprotein-sorting protein
VTEFQFSHMEEGVPLADSEFHFLTPKGVEVVEGLPPV